MAYKRKMRKFNVRNLNAEEIIQCDDAIRAVEIFVEMHPNERGKAILINEIPEDPK